MFTLTQLVQGTNFPDKHKIRLGRRLIRSYRSKYQSDPDRHAETDSEGNTYEVMLYPDKFRYRAETLVHRYFRDYWKGKRKWKVVEKKRKRIVKYQKIEK